METKDFYTPSLTAVLEGRNFFLSKKSLPMVKKIEEPVWKIFGELHREKVILKIEYTSSSKSRKTFSVICKVFYTDTKYFKIFFEFSFEGDFVGISLNGNEKKLEVLDDFETNLKWLLLKEIDRGNFGICLENEFDNFLKEFSDKNYNKCVGFKNLTCDPEYDPYGIDFSIEFRGYPWMPFQLKGDIFFINQHLKLHPEIPLLVSSPGERYESRELKLLHMKDKYFSNFFQPIVVF